MAQRKKNPATDPDGLRPHQRRVVNRVLAMPQGSGLVVMHGLGSGKTRTAIAAREALGGAADVIAPAALQGHWREQIGKWSKRPGAADQYRFESEQRVSRAGFHGSAPLLVVDEGHRARNPQTNLARELRNAPNQRKLILTGTPIYNNPRDLGSLINQAAGKKVLPEGIEFERRYFSPGKLARFFGKRMSHARELAKATERYVDYHAGKDESPPVSEKTVTVKMGQQQSNLYRAAIGQIPRHLRPALYRSNVDEKTLARLKPYLTGPRMISNTTAAVGSKQVQEPKIDRAFRDLRKHLKDPGGKALVYSNWLKAGVEPYRRRLDAAGIPYGVFTGSERPRDRQQAIEAFNAGRKRVLLVSSTGGEGLDLKGTRMVQVLEPHFNQAKIDQVVGRASRIGSHDALPQKERNVQVVHYIAKPRRHYFFKWPGVDDALTGIGQRKARMTKELVRLIRKQQEQRQQ